MPEKIMMMATIIIIILLYLFYINYIVYVIIYALIHLRVERWYTSSKLKVIKVKVFCAGFWGEGHRIGTEIDSMDEPFGCSKLLWSTHH